MKKVRIMPLLLALCMLCGSVAQPAQAANPGGIEYLNTYVNTGNQRQDILGVAFTQLGYKEKFENDTKYGDWCGYPYQPWCAAFVSWCARQAGISTDIMKRSARAHPNNFGVTYYNGKNYTPKPGDLFFTKTFGHVGLVWYVEGEFFYCIEGNAKYHDYKVPDDPDVDSYDVMTNKRRIRDYYFGVPAYEGCDKEHNYVKGYETAHPHKIYYKCQTCGDQYYTGYTECMADCSKCFSCGCSSASAGYYLVSTDSGPLRIRASHSTTATYLGYVSTNAVVYVHGTNPKTGWAYIEYDGVRGHIKLRYLTKYHNIPAKPNVTAEQTEYLRNDNVTVNWDAPANTEQYRLKVFKDGNLYLEKNMATTRTYTLESLAKGVYEVQVTACNRSGVSEVGMLKFTVRDTYTVSFDACGGSGLPEPQTMHIGQSLTLSDIIPVRDGYTFLGWSDNQQGTFATYNAGSVLNSDNNMTLYAVWKENNATPQTMTIAQMPTRTIYLKDEMLDTGGLALRLTYSDGSGHIITEGYATAGFDSQTYGTKTVAVTYASLNVNYDIQIAPYIPGDMDLNKAVDRDDVMQLLWYISFPEQFAVEGPADFNKDGSVDRDDVMHLLWHVTFPDQFPLEVIWTGEDEPIQSVTEGDEP